MSLNPCAVQFPVRLRFALPAIVMPAPVLPALVLPALVLAALLSVLAADRAWSQDKFPNRPMRLVIPFPPGGGTDVVHRAAAGLAEKTLGQPIVILNKPGAAGVIGALEIERAAPDGYTLGGIASTALLTQHTAQNANSWARMAPIVALTYDAAVIAVHPDSSWKSLGDLIAHAKANPGKLNIGNGGAGTLQHMFAIALEQRAGIDVAHIPYPGGGQAVTGLLGKQIDCISVDIATAYAHAQSGSIRLLGIAARERHPEFPDIPLYREQGVDLDIGIWRLIVAPAETPTAIIEQVRSAYTAAIRNPGFAKVAQGSQIVDMSLPDTIAAMNAYSSQMKALWTGLQARAGK